jgi:hypothetical protein
MTNHQRYGDWAQLCSQPCTYNRSPSRHDSATTICWYHRHFGAQTQNCTEPCAFRQQRKPAQQTSVAAHICITATGRLFITNRYSKHRFLIDTDLDFCVFPRKLIPQLRSRVNYDLTANSTTIPTYGWLPLSFSLGLCRDFTWRFVVANITQLLIGAEFLSLQKQSPVGRRHVVVCTCPSRLLSKFPDLTRPQWSSAGSAPHPDYTRPTSHLLTTSTGT